VVSKIAARVHLVPVFPINEAVSLITCCCEHVKDSLGRVAANGTFEIYGLRNRISLIDLTNFRTVNRNIHPCAVDLERAVTALALVDQHVMRAFVLYSISRLSLCWELHDTPEADYSRC
jgi:hypothetical protein